MEKALESSSKASVEKTIKKKSRTREYVEALLTAFLIAFFLRTFVVEAFKIPSKSMVPTLMVGDHIFVNKFIYGLRLPFSKKWITKFKEPKRGEVIVFIYPTNEKLDFIKRVVGLPGDKLRFLNDDVFINGEKVSNVTLPIQGVHPDNKRKLKASPPQNFAGSDDFAAVPFSPEWNEYDLFLERLGETTHLKQEGDRKISIPLEVAVPKDMLFVMGDNRDNSSDSREWGFVPLRNVKGRAMFVWLSLDHDLGGVRWSRMGHWIR